MAVLSVEALDELVEIRAFQRSLFQSEVLIRAQVIDPKLFRPWFFAGRFAVEEEEGWQRRPPSATPAGRSPSTAFEEDVIWDDDRGPAMLLEYRKNVLEEVELFIARRSREIVTVNAPFPAILFAHDGETITNAPGGLTLDVGTPTTGLAATGTLSKITADPTDAGCYLGQSYMLVTVHR